MSAPPVMSDRRRHSREDPRAGGGVWRGIFPILLRNPDLAGIMGEGVPMPRLLRMPAQAAARRI